MYFYFHFHALAQQNAERFINDIRTKSLELKVKVHVQCEKFNHMKHIYTSVRYIHHTQTLTHTHTDSHAHTLTESRE